MNSGQTILQPERPRLRRRLEAIVRSTEQTTQTICTAKQVEDCSTVGLPFWKRALDLLCVLCAAPFWLPVMLIIAAVIKIVSPGPALFRQERIGFRGRGFTCFKFRTMKVNADTGVHQRHLSRLMDSNVPMKKLDSAGDPRLIRYGLLLRSLGLDELPQLLNVLLGQMSLVGPRPCVRYEYEQYDNRARQRCAAIPGLTGLWQVNGKNRTTFQEMIDMDVYYAMNKTLLLDLKILFKTIPAVIAQTRDVSQDTRPEAAVAPMPER